MSNATVPAALIAALAKEHLDVETLETRNSDRLDFHDVAVWNIKAALEAAYRAGQAAAAKPAGQRGDTWSRDGGRRISVSIPNN